MVWSNKSGNYDGNTINTSTTSNVNELYGCNRNLTFHKLSDAKLF